MTPYDPRNWYWIVGGDETRAYSSAAGDYVPSANATFTAWKAAGGVPTRIASEEELAEVLAQASVRPVQAGMLDRFKDRQAEELTLALVAKVLFNHENRIRTQAGQPAITANQFRTALKAML